MVLRIAKTQSVIEDESHFLEMNRAIRPWCAIYHYVEAIGVRGAAVLDLLMRCPSSWTVLRLRQHLGKD